MTLLLPAPMSEVSRFVFAMRLMAELKLEEMG